MRGTFQSNWETFQRTIGDGDQHINKQYNIQNTGILEEQFKSQLGDLKPYDEEQTHNTNQENPRTNRGGV